MMTAAGDSLCIRWQLDECHSSSPITVRASVMSGTLSNWWRGERTSSDCGPITTYSLITFWLLQRAGAGYCQLLSLVRLVRFLFNPFPHLSLQHQWSLHPCQVVTLVWEDDLTVGVCFLLEIYNWSKTCSNITAEWRIISVITRSRSTIENIITGPTNYLAINNRRQHWGAWAEQRVNTRHVWGERTNANVGINIKSQQNTSSPTISWRKYQIPWQLEKRYLMCK